MARRKERTTWEQPRSPSYTQLGMDRCLTHIGREGSRSGRPPWTGHISSIPGVSSTAPLAFLPCPTRSGSTRAEDQTAIVRIPSYTFRSNVSFSLTGSGASTVTRRQRSRYRDAPKPRPRHGFAGQSHPGHCRSDFLSGSGAVYGRADQDADNGSVHIVCATRPACSHGAVIVLACRLRADERVAVCLEGDAKSPGVGRMVADLVVGVGAIDQ